MRKCVIIHPAIAPYRIDFFNSLCKEFNAKIYLEHKDVLEQKFDNKRIFEQLNFNPIYLNPGFLVKNLRLDVLKFLFQEKPDIVICSEYNIIGFLIIIYKLLFNWQLSVFSICDDSYSIAVNCKGVRKFMRSILLHFLKGVILSDNKALEWYREHFCRYCRFVYFPIIQDEYHFLEKLDQSKSLSVKLKEEHNLIDSLVILYVGRLVSVKNVSTLIKAFRMVKSCNDRARLVLVGEGDEKRSLVSLTSELGLVNDVIFVGKKEGEGLYAWYNIGDLFVLPSIFEPFGAVTNEALLSGCYVICSSKAGSSCLIESGVNGDVFNPVDVDELAKKILLYLPKSSEVPKQNKMQISYDERMIGLISFLKENKK